GDDRAKRNARRLHIDKQEADAELLLCSRVGAHEAEDPIGVLAEGGPRLLAVDNVVVSLTPGRSFQRGEIRARARLRESLAPPIVEVRGARQEPALLLLGAELG